MPIFVEGFWEKYLGAIATLVAGIIGAVTMICVTRVATPTIAVTLSGTLMFALAALIATATITITSATTTTVCIPMSYSGVWDHCVRRNGEFCFVDVDM
ncbi:hypothetical protein HOY82DRAFT_599182 [Tuber indicum]|nr:hypothetical protein HOY82DRAFT_599182 [Tuber indicum]